MNNEQPKEKEEVKQPTKAQDRVFWRRCRAWNKYWVRQAIRARNERNK